jgi:DNA-directed RNA polymerase specialized sigma24 family protein
MTGDLVAAHTCVSAHASDYLPDHVAQIATGDRQAFRCLYTFLAMRVWRDASRLLPNPVDSQAVTRSTFVEVWYLAKLHLKDSGLDADAWIAAVTARHVDERLRSADAPSLVRTAYDRHTYCDFASMIGTSAGRSWKRSSDDP